MQLSIKHWWFFIGYQTNRLATWWQARQRQPVYLQSDIYRTCDKLPMDRFIDCLCNDNIQALSINGNQDEKKLNEAWLTIMNEYYELRGDDINLVEQWQLSRDVTRLNNHLFLLEVAIDFLKDKWSDSLSNSIRRLGYVFNPSSKIPGEYNEDLNKVINRSKTKYIQLQQLSKALQLQIDGLGDKKPKRDYFDNLLIQIEEMQKVSYTLEVLTVQKFILLEKKYWHQIELLKARAVKHGKY